MVLTKKESQFAKEFLQITENKKYRELKDYPRHGSTNTYDHCVRVARRAWKLAPKIGVDPFSAAKVGFLHDFCLVDYHQDDKETHGGRWYCFYHPEEAVENAEGEGFYLSDIEKRAIWSHMFPLSKSCPSSRLGYLLTFCDKTIAAKESLMNAAEAFGKAKSVLVNSCLKTIAILKGRKNT